MKIQRYRYAFRSKNGYCWFEGFYPQLSATGPGETAVNRLLAHIWRPDQRSACKGTSVESYRQFTDFHLTASSDTILSFRFDVTGQFEKSKLTERRVEGFTVDLQHGREVTAFGRAQYDELLSRADSAQARSESRPSGFYVRPTGIMLLCGGTREVHVSWASIADIIEHVPALRSFLKKSE